MNNKNQTTRLPSLLEVKDLQVYFPIRKGIFFQRIQGYVKAVDGVSFSIPSGATLGIVGESGCGKTTTGLAISRLIQKTGGEIHYEGNDISNLSTQEKSNLNRKIQMVFQDPYSSLNPRMTIGNIIADPLKVHQLYRGHALTERVKELLVAVGLNPDMINRYPYQFSGGQRQRVGIARALAVDPSLIICDEPVSALDVSIQAQILNLLTELQAKMGLTYLFISHDLAVVKHISNQIAVMYLGQIVEMTSSERFYREPLHPYSKSLLRAVHVPDPHFEKEKKRSPLRGDIPNPAHPPIGCNFSTRCPEVQERCKCEKPKLIEVSPDHFVACHLCGIH